MIRWFVFTTLIFTKKTVCNPYSHPHLAPCWNYPGRIPSKPRMQAFWGRRLWSWRLNKLAVHFFNYSATLTIGIPTSYQHSRHIFPALVTRHCLDTDHALDFPLRTVDGNVPYLAFRVSWYGQAISNINGPSPLSALIHEMLIDAISLVEKTPFSCLAQERKTGVPRSIRYGVSSSIRKHDSGPTKRKKLCLK